MEHSLLLAAALNCVTSRSLDQSDTNGGVCVVSKHASCILATDVDVVISLVQGSKIVEAPKVLKALRPPGKLSTE